MRNTFLLLSLLSLFGFMKHGTVLPEPPGTKKLDDTLYFDQSDATVEDWQLFLQYAARYGYSKDSLYPDTTFLVGGINDPSMMQQPVCGLSYRQAQLYCEWRSRFVSSIKNDTVVLTCSSPYYQKVKKADPDKLFEVNYRLPKSSEWTEVRQKCKITSADYFSDSASSETGKFHLRCIATYRKR